MHRGHAISKGIMFVNMYLFRWRYMELLIIYDFIRVGRRHLYLYGASALPTIFSVGGGGGLNLFNIFKGMYTFFQNDQCYIKGIYNRSLLGPQSSVQRLLVGIGPGCTWIIIWGFSKSNQIKSNFIYKLLLPGGTPNLQTKSLGSVNAFLFWPLFPWILHPPSDK